MTALLAAAIKAAWAFVLPWTGKFAAWALPWLVPLRAALPFARLMIGLAVIAGSIGIIAWMAWPDKQVTIADARQLCEDSRLRAELTATKAALASAQATLRLRADTIAHAESFIESMNEEMEKIRAEAPDPDAPVFAADDPWLQRKRAR